MNTSMISPPQLAAIHTLYAHFARSSLDIVPGRERTTRLEWISKLCGRTITTAKDLTRVEAADVIDALRLACGLSSTAFTRPRSRQAARAAGTHGRRGITTNEIAIASRVDLSRIDETLTRLGWDQFHFEAWLRSPSSPVAVSSRSAIRTVAQTNRIWWALKHMLKSARKWNAA